VLFIDPGASPIGFAVPFFLVGSGFVIATTVRTAIIFASVPRGMPATAAALNEASLAVGGRLGIVLTAAVVSRTATDGYAAQLGNLPSDVVNQAVAQFRSILTATQDLPFAEIASALHPGDIDPYLTAYDGAVQLALLFGAAVAILAGALGWLLLGRHDPLATIWELRDERQGAIAAPLEGPGAAG
jgi:hypothetical protein